MTHDPLRQDACSLKPFRVFAHVMILIAFFGGATHALSQDVQVVSLTYRHVQQPQSLPDILSTKEAQAITSAIAAYYGIDPKTVAVAFEAMRAATQTEGGETRRYEMPVPSGYEYCKTFKEGTQSQSRSTNFSLFLDPSRRTLKWNSWAKKDKIWAGSSWIKRDFSLLFVKPQDRSHYNCVEPGIYKGVTPLIFMMKNPRKVIADYTSVR